MGWPGTPPWSGLTAAGLRPVIVALINAVGDRQEAIGLSRRTWTVNTAQSNTSLTLGTKASPLVEADLYSLDLFRYNYWGTLRTDIVNMVELGDTASGSPESSLTECRGWSKAGTDGTGSDRWTVAELETDAGLGAMNSSDISDTTTPHLFDEKAPNRLRLILDNLIYPVIYPTERRGITGQAWIDALLATEDASEQRGIDAGQDGDAAWADLGNQTVISRLSDPLGNNCIGGEVGIGAGLVAEAQNKPLLYQIYDFDERTATGNGCLGTVIARHISTHQYKWYLEGVDFTVGGNSDSQSGGAAASQPGSLIRVVYSDTTAMGITGQQTIEHTIDAWGGTGSPFDYALALVSDMGTFFCSPISRNQETFAQRDTATRLILDISGVISN